MTTIKEKMNQIAFRAYKRNRFAWTLLTNLWWRLILSLDFFMPPMYKQVRQLAKLKSFSYLHPNISEKSLKILIYATRQDPEHLLWYYCIALALKKRGHEVVFVRCDQPIRDCCNTGHYPNLLPTECNKCSFCAKKFYYLSGFQSLPLSKYFVNNDQKKAGLAIADVAPQNYFSFEDNGVPLGKLVHTSVVEFLRSDQIWHDHESLKIYSQFLGGALALYWAEQRIIKDINPDRIVMLNGWFASESMMLNLAKLNSIPATIMECGYLPNTLAFYHNEPVDYDASEFWVDYKDIPLSDDETARVNNYLSGRRNNQNSLYEYWRNSEDDRSVILHTLGLDGNKKIVVLFPNINWDSALLNAEIAFGSMYDWVKTTIVYFCDKTDVQLLVRGHPAEAAIHGAMRDSVVNRIKAEFGNLPNHIKLIEPTNPINSYVLMDLAEYGIVYTSSTGMELAAIGKPVVCCGKIHYREKGFTVDVNNKQEYLNVLSSLSTNSFQYNKEEAIKIAKRYYNFWLFKVMIPFKFVKLRQKGNPSSLNFTELSQFEPGQNLSLDIICQGILDGKPFIYDKRYLTAGGYAS